MAVDLGPAAADAMLVHCRRAGLQETGGVLLGHYSPWLDRAIVIAASGPPRDSVLHAYTFRRGVSGLTALFSRAWKRGEHYLGDWHFHPNAPARPSLRDVRQMQAFATDPDYQCKRTVLMVVGGDPSRAWTMGVYAIGGGATIPLVEALK